MWKINLMGTPRESPNCLFPFWDFTLVIIDSTSITASTNNDAAKIFEFRPIFDHGQKNNHSKRVIWILK